MYYRKNRKIVYVLLYFFAAFIFLWFSKSAISTENQNNELIQKETNNPKKTISLSHIEEAKKVKIDMR